MAYNVYVVTAAQLSAMFTPAWWKDASSARRSPPPAASSPPRRCARSGCSPGRCRTGWCRWSTRPPPSPSALPFQLKEPELKVSLDQAEAGRERASLDPGMPAGPDAGFYGRDETLLALDRASDTHQVVLLHAWAGGGKTTTAAESPAGSPDRRRRGHLVHLVHPPPAAAPAAGPDRRPLRPRPHPRRWGLGRRFPPTPSGGTWPCRCWAR